MVHPAVPAVGMHGPLACCHAGRAWWVAEITGVARMMTEQTDEPKTILDQGYLIVRGAIEPERLEPVRATAELFLDRARERSRGDPNVGWGRAPRAAPRPL